VTTVLFLTSLATFLPGEYNFLASAENSGHRPPFALITCAQQLLSRNPAETLVDKDNHANDAMKYCLMSHSEPAVRTKREMMAEKLKPLAEMHEYTSAYIRFRQMEDEDYQGDDPPRLGRYRPWRTRRHR
jgi:hypothetical protein